MNPQMNQYNLPPTGMPHLNNGFDDLNNGPQYEDPLSDPSFWLPFECECHGMRFPKRADLNRHVNKELKKFKCSVMNCPSADSNGNEPCFGTLNDQKRHYRDVHRMTLDGRPLGRFNCPWQGCKRNNEGFPRKKNLENHLKSFHDSEVPSTAPTTVEAGPSSSVLEETTAPLDQWSQQTVAAVATEPMLQLDPDEETDEVLKHYSQDWAEARHQLQSMKVRIDELGKMKNQLQSDYNAIAKNEERIHNKLADRRRVLRLRRAAKRN